MQSVFLIFTFLMAAATSAQTQLTPPLGYFTLSGFVQTLQGPGFLESAAVSASNYRFYVDRATQASCTAGGENSSCCTPNRVTSFVVLSSVQQDGGSGPSPLYLNTAGVPRQARQQVYCSPITGELQFTPPGELIPFDTLGAANFTYLPESRRNAYGSLTNGKFKFTLCKTGDGYTQVYCSSHLLARLDCFDSVLATRPDFQGIAAGQYD